MNNQHPDTAITQVNKTKTRKCILENKTEKEEDKFWRLDWGFLPNVFKMMPGPQPKGVPEWSLTEIKKCSQ